jgi:hypothetical protein
MAQEDLTAYLETAVHKGFVASPRYFSFGDYLTYFVKQDRCYSRRVNELLTVYISVDDGSLVGCKVKGVRCVLKRINEMHVLVSDKRLTIGMFFFSVAAITKELSSRDQVLDYAKRLPATEIPCGELAVAA